MRAMASEPIIDVRQLTKHYRVARKQAGMWHTLRHFFRRQYRTIEAVNDVTFRIEPGEIVGFLGPNGAGKTTTLKMLTGLIHPTSGQVSVVGHTPFARRHGFLKQITLVMGQKQQLMWDLPAADALRINAAVYRIDEQTFQHRLAELSEMLDLRAELEQPVRKLSLGQRMKAEFLAALLHQPSVLFLDEPTLGLDVNAQAAVRQFLKHYNQQYGATILMTSHYMADITALCERVMLIHEGRLRFDGGLQNLIEQFAPHREVMLELDTPIDPDVLRDFGEIESVQGRVAKLLIDRTVLTGTIDRILDRFEVVDLQIHDPPVERIIGQVFAGTIPTRPDASAMEPVGAE